MKKPDDINSRTILHLIRVFGDCVKEIVSRRIDGARREFATSGRPPLSKETLFELGTEFGEHGELRLLLGRVMEILRVRAGGTVRKIPHISWASLVLAPNRTERRDEILPTIRTGDAVHFVHSYHAVPTQIDSIIATADYQGGHDLRGSRQQEHFWLSVPSRKERPSADPHSG